MLIATICLVAVALVAVTTVKIFRILNRRYGTTQFFEDGAILTQHGIEFLPFFFLPRSKATFDQIESVELVPFHKAMLSMLFLRYGISFHTINTRLFSEYVLIKLKKPSRWFVYHFDYLLFTPKNAKDFVERLKSRMSGYETHVD